MCKDAILETIIARALTEDTMNKVIEYLTEKGYTDDDTVMLMDRAENQLCAMIVNKGENIILPLFINEEEDANIHMLMAEYAATNLLKKE